MNSCNLVGTIEGGIQVFGTEDKPGASFGMSLRIPSGATKALIKVTCSNSGAEFAIKHCHTGDLISVVGLIWIDEFGGISVRATRIDALKLEPSTFINLRKKELNNAQRKQSPVFDRP
jgi:hypothetical protein